MRLASRGRRDLDGGETAIEDRAELAAVRRQARAVAVRSVLAAVLATAVYVALTR